MRPVLIPNRRILGKDVTFQDVRFFYDVSLYVEYIKACHAKLFLPTCSLALDDAPLTRSPNPWSKWSKNLKGAGAGREVAVAATVRCQDR